MLTLAGVNDENLIELQKQSGAKVALRGDTLTVSGSNDSVERATPVAQRMIDAAKQRVPLTADDVLRMTLEDVSDTGGNGSGLDDGETRIVLPGIRKIIRPKTRGQNEYLRLIMDNDIVIGIGPAGTGKTYL
ncbi:MAG TPA: PhoH family protein, partial [Longimicrobiales bacterium]|nr:PhoH family protein [Longimicrobiales bacterium]